MVTVVVYFKKRVLDVHNLTFMMANRHLKILSEKQRCTTFSNRQIATEAMQCENKGQNSEIGVPLEIKR